MEHCQGITWIATDRRASANFSTTSEIDDPAKASGVLVRDRKKWTRKSTG